MGIIPSRNLEAQRREENGIVYFDRGTLEGKNGRKYDRFAIQTHFVQRGEDQAELVRKYVLPISRPGDVLSFGAKVMAMCTNNVKTRDEVKPGFWANFLWRFAGINHTGVGMHEPYKLQLVIDMCGLPRVLLAAFLSAVTKPFGAVSYTHLDVYKRQHPRTVAAHAVDEPPGQESRHGHRGLPQQPGPEPVPLRRVHGVAPVSYTHLCSCSR